MSHLSMILSVLMMLCMLVFVAPGIFALNRGHVLRNMALWLAIFFALGVVYQTFGPGSPHPLFGLPDGMARLPVTAPAPETPAENKSGNDKDNSAQDFIPPKE